jgi:hypothetical protein
MTAVGLPRTPYVPQPGDVVLFSDANLFWKAMYAIALTGKPGHSGLIVAMPDGGTGIFECGYDDTPWMRVVPVAERLRSFKGCVWVRRPKCALTAEQACRLTEFALVARDRPYALARFAGQLTPLRSRGPVKTWFVGKPKGIGGRYQCAEGVLEALVYAGLLPAETTRPAATYPRDLFFDSSPNLYIHKHPPLAARWEPPARYSHFTIEP